MSLKGESSPGLTSTAELIKCSDATSNGTLSAGPRANGVTRADSITRIGEAQVDESFSSTVINSSQPNDLALASSALCSSPMENVTVQPTSLGHDASHHTVDGKTADSPLSGSTPHSPLSKGGSTITKTLLVDSAEQRSLPEATDVPMDISVLNPDNSSITEIPPKHMLQMASHSDSRATLPSLELPHHPPTPFSTKTASDTLGEASIHHELAPSEDHVMRDATKSPGKVAREREEEADEEPVAKRSRTDEDLSQTMQFKIPQLPQSNSQHATPLTSTAAETNGTNLVAIETPSGQDLALPLTNAQQRFLLKAVQGLRRMKDAAPFNQAVDPVALKIPSYPEIIKRPMDLSKIEINLTDNSYASALDCVKDVEQVINNSITFNGIDHTVSQAALKMKSAFEKRLANLPGPDTVDPSSEKKSKRAVVGPKIAPPRRESRSSLGGNARSPSAATSQQTFALGPQGVPLIRRDSTAQDGRPKREIHPPAPRDLPYANQKPKKKKYQLELKFCQEVLAELKKAKYQSLSWPFAQPVDPVALNIPHYHNVIKKPMDLSTIDKKLAAGQYENAKEFEVDVRLMFNNCYKFNPEGNAVHRLGKDFEEIFSEKWAEKKQYLEDHTAPSGPQTPGTSPEPQDDEEEEEEEPEDEIIALQKQIAAMSKQVELIQKKKGSPPVASKKPIKGGKAAKKESKKTTTAAPIKSEKKSAVKSSKKEKIPYVTYEQKQDISNRINNLPAPRMATALTIIRDNMPNLKVI